MQTIDFLRLLLPDTGVYCLAAIRKPVIEHVFLNDINGFEAASAAVSGPTNQYFACAAFDPDKLKQEQLRASYDAEKPELRTQENVRALRSFWLDIDCGVGKKNAYPTKREAITAAQQFITAVGLPQPIAATSGNGIQLFWPLVNEVAPNAWKPVADRLKAVCREQGLIIDPACTGDSARVMRLPNTLNYRDPAHPKEAKVFASVAHPVSLLEFAKILGAPDAEPEMTLGFEAPEYAKREMDETTKRLLGNIVSSFARVMSAEPSCAQLQYIANEQDQIDEPLWRAGLSVAQACIDRETAIHNISKNHPQYSATETKKKAAQTKGPYTCETFDSLNPEKCKGCPHKGEITSPIQLGKEVPAATLAQRTVTVVAPTGTPQTLVIPDYPWPFMRGAQGGVYVEQTDPKSGKHTTAHVVYEHDIYVTKRMRDPELGETLWVKLHLPKDGIREFSIPLAHVLSKDKFRDTIAAQGVTVLGKNLDYLMLYMAKWTNQLQEDGETEIMRGQMGWTPEGGFVVGTEELVLESGLVRVKYSPPAVSTVQLCSHLHAKGTLAEWKSVVNFYANPGMEAFAFALFLGFGAPLMRYTQLKGGMYNMMSSQSGVGKSTALLAVNSIWGEPQGLLIQPDDTYNARMHRIGGHQNLPVTQDEITNQSAEQMSMTAYGVMSGRAKSRMQGNVNAERVNQTTWQTIMLTSSNSSVADKLYSIKEFPEGELMRLIEVNVQRSDTYTKSYTDALFSKLGNNYGLAWKPYMTYVMEHPEKVMSLMASIQAQTDKDAMFTQRERIWSAMAAVALVGGTIASNLKLHDIDVPSIAKWISAFMLNASQNIRPLDGGAASVGAYMGENYNNTLVIRDQPLESGMAVIAAREPRGSLLIRYETDTGNAFFALAPFKTWCAKHQVSYTELMTSLRDNGIRADVVKKRMGKGTALTMPACTALLIHLPRGNKLGISMGEDDGETAEETAAA